MNNAAIDSDLSKIIRRYEEDGLIILKLTNEDLLDGDRPRQNVLKETIYPPVAGFLERLTKAYSEHIQNSHLDIAAQREIENFNFKYRLPRDFGKIYSLPSMPETLPKQIFIEMLTRYKIGLAKRLGNQGFSESYTFNLSLVIDELLINAFKHGNGEDISKRISVNEIYMRGTKRHGYVMIVQDSGVKVLTQEDVDTHLPQIDPKTGKPKITASHRGFAVINALANWSWILPYERGNSVAAHLFEKLPSS